MISAAEVAAWLEANARECERFELRLRPEACAKMAAEWPLRCEGCERAVAATAIEPRPDEKGRYRMIPTIHKEKQRLGGRRKAGKIKEKREGRA